jgi:hypothetical protein
MGINATSLCGTSSRLQPPNRYHLVRYPLHLGLWQRCTYSASTTSSFVPPADRQPGMNGVIGAAPPLRADNCGWDRFSLCQVRHQQLTLQFAINNSTTAAIGTTFLSERYCTRALPGTSVNPAAAYRMRTTLSQRQSVS